MPRSWSVGRQVFTGTALCAMAVAAVFAVTPVGGWVLHPAVAAPQERSVAGQYTCDLSRYGYTGPPLQISATTTLAATATAVAQTGFSPLFANAGVAGFTTSLAILPASVAARLTNLSKISLQATLPVNGAPAASPVAKIWGTIPRELLPAGPLTQLQVVNATDTAFFSSPGTALIQPQARSLLFTPYRDGKPLPTISCQVLQGPAVAPAAVTVTGAAIGAPVYGCASNYRTSSYRTPLPMTITTSGVSQVGRVLTVTLSSPETGLASPGTGTALVSPDTWLASPSASTASPSTSPASLSASPVSLGTSSASPGAALASPGTVLAAAPPNVATKLTFTGSLTVTGAQAGELVLKKTTTTTDAPTFAVSARLRLTKAGTDEIFFPRRFTYRVAYWHGNRPAVFTCTLATSPAPAGRTLTVAR